MVNLSKKFFFSILPFFLLLGLLLSINFRVVFANTCSGTGSRSVTNEWCIKDKDTGTYSCGSETLNDSGDCVERELEGWNCGWYMTPECDCVLSGGECYQYCRSTLNLWNTSGCTSCIGANGDCNDEAYSSGVCAASDITIKCDSTYGSSSITTSGSNFVWTCYEKCSGDSATTNDSCSVPNLPTTNGVCATIAASCTAPTSGLCTTGTASAVTTNANTFTWTCSGSCGGGVTTL